MKKLVALASMFFAGVFWLAVQPAHAQGTASAAPPGTVPNTIEKSPETILKNNPRLGSNLEALLGDAPAQDAAKGYKSIEDFVTAVHASHDLAIPFPQFKCAELGGKYCSPVTDAKPAKIEAAILALKPEAGKDGAKQAVKTAKQEGKPDLKGVDVY